MKKTFKLIPFETQKDVSIIATLKKRGSKLYLRYQINDPKKQVVIKNHPKLTRIDGLWNDTCFEFFIRQPSTGHYLEFHFAPKSGAWNVLHFETYRKRSVQEFPWKEIRPLANQSGFSLDLKLVEKILGPGPLQFGITSVVVTKDKTNYFALIHGDKVANFHYPPSFIETLKF